MNLLIQRKCAINPLYADRIIIFLNVLLLSLSTLTSPALGQENMAKARREFLSSPQQCARECRENEPSKTCYYHFTVENYVTVGQACDLCTPNNTGVINDCQCVFADGFERTILTVNRMLPGPSIQVCLGDKIVVDVENHMLGMELAIHWHGLFQKGTQYYDGVPLLTQCPIPQGTTFRYQFYANNGGTHFWHAHSGLQKLDGLHGSFTVRDYPRNEPNYQLYDYDSFAHEMLLSDWMHQQATERFPGLRKRLVGEDAQAILINGMGQYKDPDSGNITDTPLAKFSIKKGKRYRFRMINSFATDCPAELTIQRHNLTIIASDGQPLVPVNVTTLISYSGERYDFVINADQPPGAYWIQVRGIGNCGVMRVQQLGVLHYAGRSDKPSSNPPTYDQGLPKGVILNPMNGPCNTQRADAVCVNQLRFAGSMDSGILQKRPDVKIKLPFNFFFYEQEDLYRPDTYQTFLMPPILMPTISLVDNISYVDPPSPPLSQIDDIPPDQFCNGGNLPDDCSAPCTCSHVVDIPLNAVVEFILVDTIPQPNLSHPFHLHGYAFHVIGMGGPSDTNVKNISMDAIDDLDRKGMLKRNLVQPPAKDNVVVPRGGYAIFRFRADNPGYWLMHCHFAYHLVIGMKLVFRVGDTADLPPVPPGFPVCGNYLPPITDEDC